MSIRPGLHRRAAVVVLAAVIGACAAGRLPDLDTSRVPRSTTSAVPATTAEPYELVVPPELEALQTRPLTIRDGGVTYVLTVAVADSAATRSQGLMKISDLGDLDGMLFQWSSPTEAGFWMKDTLIPLDIAFFTAEGGHVDDFSMAPCPESPCTKYHASGPYTYAVEVTQGTFSSLTAAAVLELDA